MGIIIPRLQRSIPSLRGLLRSFSVFGLLLTVACTAPTLEAPEATSEELKDEVRRQRITYVKALFEEQERLARIGHTVSVRVVDLCGDRTTYTTGAFLFDWDQTKDEWVDAANEAIGINLHTPGIEVLIVLPGSPAEAAGLRVGDRVIRLDDWRVPAEWGAFDKFRDRLNASLAGGQQVVEFRILRGAEFRTIKLAPIRACDYPVLIAESNEINAYTDGRKIVVFRGMLRFVRNDDELAIVITHELAHVALGHVDAQRQNAMAGAAVGAIFDVLIAGATGVHTRVGQTIGASAGALAYSKEFEAEADYMGAYMMAQAGYDYTKIPDFQRYTGTADRDSMDYGATHPSSAQRVISSQKTVQEIKEKNARGVPLIPDLKARPE